jgi:hypothetical protein
MVASNHPEGVKCLYPTTLKQIPFGGIFVPKMVTNEYMKLAGLPDIAWDANFES